MIEPKLNYDDVTIVPEVITDIDSRSKCNPYDENGMLPIFASCMSSVVSMENAKDFNAAKIYAVIPRSYSLKERWHYLHQNTLNFVAFSLKEVEECFLTRKVMIANYYAPLKVCIDLANGHMEHLISICKQIKDFYGNKVILMTGNIANPETYRLYEEAGVDYVRCGIGGGSLCSTSSNVSIHYPYFSLIQEISEIKKEINGKCKIIADGNIKGYRDIQKALIYADYVMIGGLFNKAIESAGKTTYGKSYFNVRGYKFLRPLKTLLTYGKEVDKEDYDKVMRLIKENKITIWKEEFGQSTKQAQALVAKANGQTPAKLKTAEGLVKYQKVEYTLAGWAENETDYLRSGMSYTNSHNLEEYKDSQWVRITQIRYNN